jgi:hypothetical protein
VCGHVTTVEIDPLRSELARHNLAVQGITNVTCLVGGIAELRDTLDLASFDGFFADPARRTVEGVRVKDAAEYSPPLDELITLTNARIRAIKVSPGLFFDAPHHGWCRQFLGVADECLEQTLWFGAPVIDSSIFLVDEAIGWSPPTSAIPALPHPHNLSGFVVEAHATINRSQLLETFFAERGIALIAPDVAYGVSEQEPAASPLLARFAILEAAPYSLPLLHSRLNALGWTNRTEIKKRNYGGDIEQIRTALKLPPHFHGAPFGTILIFTWRGTPWLIIGRRIGA